jgi:hypothetical protein
VGFFILRSLKSKVTGPKPVARAKCECAWEVYMSVGAQADINDGARMAASGDEASIIVFWVVKMLLRESVGSD